MRSKNYRPNTVVSGRNFFWCAPAWLSARSSSSLLAPLSHVRATMPAGMVPALTFKSLSAKKINHRLLSEPAHYVLVRAEGLEPPTFSV